MSLKGGKGPAPDGCIKIHTTYNLQIQIRSNEILTELYSAPLGSMHRNIFVRKSNIDTQLLECVFSGKITAK